MSKKSYLEVKGNIQDLGKLRINILESNFRFIEINEKYFIKSDMLNINGDGKEILNIS
ncbi:hypothetical protein [Tissierella praeacuta]|uniref:hypothetical protein n=1 Tax=Tissierella praeacuta TaxID=43131 RepID=UPI003340EBB0